METKKTTIIKIIEEIEKDKSKDKRVFINTTVAGIEGNLEVATRHLKTATWLHKKEATIQMFHNPMLNSVTYGIQIK